MGPSLLLQEFIQQNYGLLLVEISNTVAKVPASQPLSTRRELKLRVLRPPQLPKALRACASQLGMANIVHAVRSFLNAWPEYYAVL
jgi:hypothetical protein